MSRFLLVTGALLGGTAVATGAFGAHALQGVLSERALGWFDTAVEYHARHALAVFACGLLSAMGGTGASLRVAATGLLLGTLIFSGSLYVMAFTGLTWLGAITPIGGVLLIIGWAALAWAAIGLGTAQTHQPQTDKTPE